MHAHIHAHLPLAFFLFIYELQTITRTNDDFMRIEPIGTWGGGGGGGGGVNSSVRNTNFPHTLKPWNSRASVG